MALQFGEPRTLGEITPDEVLRHPVWLYVWEAGRKGGAAEDSASLCPVKDGADVGPGMVEPVVALRVKGTHLLAFGSYNAELDQLEAISVWSGGAWQGMGEAGLRQPVCLTPLASIHGQQGVEFICRDLDLDVATRAHA